MYKMLESCKIRSRKIMLFGHTEVEKTIVCKPKTAKSESNTKIFMCGCVNISMSHLL